MFSAKSLMIGMAAAALVFGISGCASDDDDLEMFRAKDGDLSGLNAKGRNGNSPDADLSGMNDANKHPDGVTGWGNGGLNPYDDFGTPIPGLSFEAVYFQFDQSRIDSSEMGKLDQVAAYLMQNGGTGVVIEGNCDDKGSDEYNRALGERRALSSKDYLLEKGISDSRIRTVSYGEEKPAVPNTDETSRAKNRRDEFIGVTLKK